MTRATKRAIGLACMACAMPAVVHAHVLATPYVLPVPFWMYTYGCAATLIVTFAVLGYFWGAPAPVGHVRGWELVPGRTLSTAGWWGLQLLRAAAVGCFLSVVVAGLLGTPNPERNINMTLFWIVFLLGFTYLTVLVGDLYSLINPWKVVVDCLQRIGVDLAKPRVPYPPILGYWPAFAFYVALIWLELFALPKPSTLSVVIAVYSAVTLLGAALFGSHVWFRQCDVFSVFFRVIATLAPVEYSRAPDGQSLRIRLRPPLVGGINDRADHISLVLFILFMLSSTVYDAIHQTVLWVGMYWRPLVALLESFWGMDAATTQSTLIDGYVVYQRGGLLISSFLYLAVYLFVLWWARRASRVATTIRALALSFAYSLVPIAFAYHFAHYYTLLITRGGSLPWLSSDLLSLGWNLLNLAPPDESMPLQMAIVWHTQVAVILLGHVASVFQSHVIAMKTFQTRRQVIASQLPLLFLMVAYTVTGLWILSLPLSQ